MQRQIWVIRASFATLTLGSEVLKPQLHLQQSSSSSSYERCISMARALGDRLLALALHSEQGVGWLGVVPVNERAWHLLPTGSDLYGGLSGIALFLGYLGMVTEDTQYTVLARQAQESARALIKHTPAARASIGAFEGYAGYIYLLAQMGKVWNEPALYYEAAELLGQLSDLIEKDGQYDVISGVAGLLNVLLSLYAVMPSELVLKLALRCGDHLLRHAQSLEHGCGWLTKNAVRALTGFSHGNAGLALSLLRLFGISHDERFRLAAQAAIAYERGMFVAEQQNWPDLRDISTAQTSAEHQHCMVAWCHGAPGIGLSRLAALKYLDDDVLYTEIAAAIATTLAQGFGHNHSLCHGDLGNLELLLVASQTLPNASEYTAQLQRQTAMLLDSMDVQGWLSGIPAGVETPGLMNGLAGMGYAMLRLAVPQRIPSVLLLEPHWRGGSSSFPE